MESKTEVSHTSALLLRGYENTHAHNKLYKHVHCGTIQSRQKVVTCQKSIYDEGVVSVWDSNGLILDNKQNTDICHHRDES